MSTRSTRSRASNSTSPTKKPAIAARSKLKPKPKSRKASTETPSPSSGDEFKASDNEEDQVKEYDSDALDDDSDAGGSKKRKRAPTKQKSVKRSPRKRTKTADNDADEVFELEEGQEIVGVVIEAPKTGRVPAGQISQNTFDFLAKLKDPKCNNREWFKLREPVYRLAENEWKAFVEEFTDLLVDVDPEIPPLPPKDVIHRIYRDIRFSNDKTPYKKGFSASFSRSGRKGIFAAYHVAIKPGDESLLAAGSWQPGKNELAAIRANILHNPNRLRQVISHPTFVQYFGKPQPHSKGERQNIFGMEDELKVAPKGIDKGHRDIDILKCRSFAVVHHFTDEQVLASDFKEEVARMVEVVRPFVHCLNDYMTFRGDDDEEGDDEEEGNDEEEE